MLDDLRNSAASSFLEEEPAPIQTPPPRQQRTDRLFGLTAPQRFVIVLLLFLMTCALGSFCLILTGRVALPF